jgi:hypothetical protein
LFYEQGICLEQVVSLRKYAKAYDLDIAPTAPKEDLIFAIMKHWTHQVCPTASLDESMSCSAVSFPDEVILDWHGPSSWGRWGSHSCFLCCLQPPLPEFEILVRFTDAAKKQNSNGNGNPMR